MRECPNCAHRDPPYWRHKRHRLFTDYCHMDDLKAWKDPLATPIERAKDIKINRYIYHLTKAGYVDRIHESDSKDGVSWREPEQQKSFPFQPKHQTRLVTEASE